MDITDNHIPVKEQAIYRAKFINELYPNAVEDLPLNSPKLKGRSVQILCLFDADRGGYQITRRSITVILIYLHKAPIMWYSKRQNTVETSNFVSDFVEMNQDVEMLKGLKYKLRMFEIEIMENDTKHFGDNNAVIFNSLFPESRLKKKRHSINYNYVQEAVASGMALIYKVDNGLNLADIFTKLLYRFKRKEIIPYILY